MVPAAAADKGFEVSGLTAPERAVGPAHPTFLSDGGNAGLGLTF